MARKKAEPAPVQDETPEESEDAQDDDSSPEKYSDDFVTTKKKPNDWLRFSFGKDAYYCLWGTEKTGWNHSNDSRAINAYRNLGLERLYNIALTRERDWIVTGKTKQQAPCVAYWDIKTGSIDVSEAEAWVKHHQGYKKLFDQIVASDSDSVEKLAKARFTVGPTGGWWAKLSDGTHHHNLPPSLEKELKKEAKNGIHPEHVALGLNGSYVVLWPESQISWSLTGYDPLHERLRDRSQPIEYVALSPWRNDHYFFVYEDGLVNYSVPSTDNDIDLYTNAYMQRRAKTDGTTLTYTKSGNGNARTSTVISPTTNFTTSPSTSPSTSAFSTTTQNGIFALKIHWPPPRRYLIGAGIAATALAAGVGVYGYHTLSQTRKADAAGRRLGPRSMPRLRAVGRELRFMPWFGLGVATALAYPFGYRRGLRLAAGSSGEEE